MKKHRTDAPEFSDVADPRYRLQRAIWAVFALILLAATLGAFGNGLLSAATASSASGSGRIAFQRVIRNQSPTELHVRARAEDGGMLLLNIPRSYLDRCRMTQAIPEPLRSIAFADHIQMEFASSPTQQESEIVLRLEVQVIGWVECGIWMGAREEPADIVRVRQFSFP